MSADGGALASDPQPVTMTDAEFAALDAQALEDMAARADEDHYARYGW